MRESLNSSKEQDASCVVESLRVALRWLSQRLGSRGAGGEGRGWVEAEDWSRLSSDEGAQAG